jgi:hypothetical protein
VTAHPDSPNGRAPAAPDRWRLGSGDGLFALAALVFVATGLIFRTAYACRINTDATAYVSIARQCLAGEFAQTINGYWGPLLSWLMVPALALGAAPLWAARLVELTAGLATLFAVRRLARQLGASRWSAGVLALCLAVPLANYSMILVTPDVLLLFLLTMYCGFVLPERYRDGRRYGVGAGLFGGLAYLAKSYALPFFIAHFVLINLMHLHRASSGSGWFPPRDGQPGLVPAPSGLAGEGRRRVLRNFALGMMVFIAVSGPWVGLLTHTYGTFTFGTAGKRAFAMVGPEYFGDDPVFETLLAPPSPAATSYWDDPTVVKLNTWGPWQSKALLLHQMRLVGGNLWEMGRQITGLFPFAAGTLLLFCGTVGAGLFRRRERETRPASVAGRDASGASPDHHVDLIPDSEGLAGTGESRGAPLASLAPVALPLLLTVAVFAGGYLPIFVEIRYLWLVVVLLILMTVLALQALAIGRRALSCFLATWLVLTCAIPAWNELVAKSHQGTEYVRLASKLAHDYRVRGNLASNDRWDQALFAAFHMNARYFGRITQDASGGEAELVAALRQHGIDYYLVWGPEDAFTPGPFPKSRLPEVTGGGIKGLRVYSIPPP